MGVDGKAPVRRSVEVEYWVVDETGRLAEPTGLVSGTPGAEREFVEPLLEVKTTPCETTAELRGELFDRLRCALDRAVDRGLGLVPLATPIAPAEIAELDSERTRIQNQVVGDDFAYVRHCAGTHIHVEQQPGHVVDQFNTLVALDPALALANSAPYFDGERLVAGARSELYRRLAYRGLAHQGRLWPYIGDTTEWTDRLTARFEEFVAAAVDAGVDRERVEDIFDPESAVWTPVQIRDEFGTVEWRSPDTTLPGHVVQLADDIAAVVDRVRETDVHIGGETGVVDEDEIVLPPFETVTEYVDAAIEDGLADPTVRSYLDRMGFDVASYRPISHDLDRGERVSPADARHLRLQHADRLREHVRERQPVDAE